MRPVRILALATILGVGMAALPAADSPGWTEHVKGGDLSAWRATKGWETAAKVSLDKTNPKKFSVESGTALLVSQGKGVDLLSREAYTDLEVHAEFVITKNSNSGIKLMGLYEIQIFDSAAVAPEKLSGEHCGGIYPRAEYKPKYTYLDKGFPPLVNAAKPAGEWQTLDIVFTAPRFDAAGKKVANACFVNVRLNDKEVQKDRDVGTPTGHAFVRKEVAKGPLLIQGDHGPIAFRSIRVKPRPGS